MKLNESSFLLGEELDFEKVHMISNDKIRVSLSEHSRVKIETSNKRLIELLNKGEDIYGLTTGVGALKGIKINTSHEDIQEGIILSHATGVGAPIPKEYIKAMMLIIANSLAKGFSGVSVSVVERLVDFLNYDIIPEVPSKGSVGSSGDLTLSSHIALAIIGRGHVYLNGKRMEALEALSEKNLHPLSLNYRDGLALINNTSYTTALASIVVYESRKLSMIADLAGALSTEAIGASTVAYDPAIHSLKPFKGQRIVSDNVRHLLRGSSLVNMSGIQDIYSVRCIPQVHGGIREALEYASHIVKIELNSVTDNPVFIKNEETNLVEVMTGGNFHGESVGIAMDALAIAISELANISDRRIAALLDDRFNNGLPAFLRATEKMRTGLMILQYTTASLVSENKVLAHPASVDSVPTSANTEDFVAMSSVSARKVVDILDNVKHVLAIELMVAAQAVDLRDKSKNGINLGTGTKVIYDFVRQKVPMFKIDTYYKPYVDDLVDNLYGLITRDGLEFIK